jgi:hypothetical protein
MTESPIFGTAHRRSPLRILAVVDDCTLEYPALVADTSISSRRVARELDYIVRQRERRPDMIVSDNGTKLDLYQRPRRRDRPARCFARLRAPASCHPQNRKFKSIPNSRYPRIKNGGHVTAAAPRSGTYQKASVIRASSSGHSLTAIPQNHRPPMCPSSYAKSSRAPPRVGTPPARFR